MRNKSKELPPERKANSLKNKDSKICNVIVVYRQFYERDTLIERNTLVRMKELKSN
jgi:hypothetical protein